MSPLFDEMYSTESRPSIPPERLLKAQFLIALYSVRSRNQFAEQLHYNLLFRWFLDMDMTEASFVETTFSKSQERLLKHAVFLRHRSPIVSSEGAISCGTARTFHLSRSSQAIMLAAVEF
ncbi:MAG: transposase [Verrucomicrobiales bacterium]